MRRLALAVLVATYLAMSPAALAQTIGVVLMHGKTGSPESVINGLADALRGAGYLVDTPEMCWSRRRIYDRSFTDCLTEVDAAVARLKDRGATRIVVAGMSQGGDAALVYGATRGGLAGIIALAPAASPEHQATLPEIAQSIADARAMVAAGRGNDYGNFADRNSSRALSLHCSAAVYLSYMDPQGPANMLAGVRNLHAPLLWVAGTADPSQIHAQAEFAQAPVNPLNRFVTVPSAHLDTPNAAREVVLAWLPTLH
jgi:esterase/lipase